MTRKEKLKKVAIIAAAYYIQTENVKLIKKKTNKNWFAKNKEINMNTYKILYQRK